MFVVVIGLGEVGRHVVRTLEWEKHDVVAVDLDPASIHAVEEHHDVMTLQGYGASPRVLTQARSKDADLVVAVTDKDEINLMAAITAKSLGAKRAIARVEGREWCTADSTGVDFDYLGVDVVFNPKLLLARELAKIAQSHGASEVIELANDRVEIVAVDLSAGSRKLGKAISRIPIPSDVLIAAIVRDGELFVPGGNDVLVMNDRIYLVGLPEQLLAAEDLFTKSREAHNVCVVGGGVIGENLAGALQHQGAKVTLIEKNREIAHRIKTAHPGITVLHGDGTDLELLREYEIGTYDFFAACTHEDEVNLMAGLLAKRIGTERTATVVHRPDYVDIHKQLGIHSVLSPRQLAADHVLRFVRHRKMKSIATLEDGAAQLLEIRALEGARAVGLPLSKMKVPRGAILCTIIRGPSVIIPNGSTVLEEGDTVIALCTERAFPPLHALFKQRAF